jgi:hypothetical protein
VYRPQRHPKHQKEQANCLGKSAGCREFDLLYSSQYFKLPLKELFVTNFKGSIIPRGTLHKQAQGLPKERQVLRTGSISIENVHCESVESVI